MIIKVVIILEELIIELMISIEMLVFFDRMDNELEGSLCYNYVIIICVVVFVVIIIVIIVVVFYR